MGKKQITEHIDLLAIAFVTKENLNSIEITKLRACKRHYSINATCPISGGVFKWKWVLTHLTSCLIIYQFCVLWMRTHNTQE